MKMKEDVQEIRNCRRKRAGGFDRDVSDENRLTVAVGREESTCIKHHHHSEQNPYLSLFWGRLPLSFKRQQTMVQGFNTNSNKQFHAKRIGGFFQSFCCWWRIIVLLSLALMANIRLSLAFSVPPVQTVVDHSRRRTVMPVTTAINTRERANHKYDQREDYCTRTRRRTTALCALFRRRSSDGDPSSDDEKGPPDQQSIMNAIQREEQLDSSINRKEFNQYTSPGDKTTSAISPYHILHPKVSPGVFRHHPVEPKALHTVLLVMRKALTAMARESAPDTASKNDSTSFIRIEHPVNTGSVDVLAWLAAQRRRLSMVSTTNIDSSSLPPLSYFYCQNQEEDTEVAALGAAHTCHTTQQVWQLLEQESWPSSSRFYGGQRFDSSASSMERRNGEIATKIDNHNNNHVSPEWKVFGANAWWFLPTVELRCQQDDRDTSRHHLVLAIHIRRDCRKAIKQALHLLEHLTDTTTAKRAPTTLPPILSRSNEYTSNDNESLPQTLDGQESYEAAVSKAIQIFDNNKPTVGPGDILEDDQLSKVVVCRARKLKFAETDWSALDVLQRWKYGGREGGHMFWMQPSKQTTQNIASLKDEMEPAPEFFGCAPERLFRVQTDGKNLVQSEALAGTRPRGSTAAEDEEYFRDLLDSPKDQLENRITADYIGKAFSEMTRKGWAEKAQDDGNTESFFVRRLLHLQHLCQSFKAQLVHPQQALNVSRFLFSNLHPTPAVCGFPLQKAIDFLKEHESCGFDRGFYSGPIGYLGADASDVYVALRSALLTRESRSARRIETSDQPGSPMSSLRVYAGGGVVKGSTVEGEWAETNYKLGVISSIFPQSPMTLQGTQTPNVAWTTAFIEELIRNGVTQFYICPGSRSTPLVVALSRAARSRVGVVQLKSVHDERAAAFRALGYGRGTNRPAAVVTSSGTAVANLYPAVVEAGMDGVPMLLLTADRPYENRDTGANQAIDQVKIFSEKYIRWFRDILPPSDEVPVSLALSDAGHSVHVARNARGPVHLNIQFRENLAPDGGRIRNDGRADSIVRFSAPHFTESPKFVGWSLSGKPFTKNLRPHQYLGVGEGARELSQLIAKSRRGLIVVGNVRPSLENEGDSQALSVDAISDFAEMIGFPVIAGAQQVDLRFRSSSVVLFAEHLLKCPLVAENLNPDLIIQLGAPLVSTEIYSLISRAIESSALETSHVLIHPQPYPERVDPIFTVTHHISSDLSVLKALSIEVPAARCGSELCSLVSLGRRLQGKMKTIIQRASDQIRTSRGLSGLSEPEIILALSESLSQTPKHSLFLSNSMAIRDSEFFLYPLSDSVEHGVGSVGSNRGASGIDGIISSAVGFAEATEAPTTLVIGDVSALHDIGSLHNLARNADISAKGRGHYPLHLMVVNNDGGGIFSFLPVARHAKDVSFNEFFGTPTSSFSFEEGADAFGLHHKRCNQYSELKEAWQGLAKNGTSSILEAVAVDRESNVLVHQEITRTVLDEINILLQDSTASSRGSRPKLTTFSNDFRSSLDSKTKTLVLLHGWMGDKSDWEEIGIAISGFLDSSWQIKAIDLAGHQHEHDSASDISYIQQSFNLNNQDSLSVDALADAVIGTLSDHRIDYIDGLVGYSLGGRVAVALRDKLIGTGASMDSRTKFVLLSSFTEAPDTIQSDVDLQRKYGDDKLADEIRLQWYTSKISCPDSLQSLLRWDSFLDRWYAGGLWGNLQSNAAYADLKRKRSKLLEDRGLGIAKCLSGCSPPRNKRIFGAPKLGSNTLMIVGERDQKYCDRAKTWQSEEGIHLEIIENAGHAVLLEAPLTVSRLIAEFLTERNNDQLPLPDMAQEKQSSSSVQSPENTKAENRDSLVLGNRTFSIPMHQSDESTSLQGIGWGEKASPKNKLKSRNGYIVALLSTLKEGAIAGVGEIAPLAGLHWEDLNDVQNQLWDIEQRLASHEQLSFDAARALQLDGFLADFLASTFPGLELLPSVRAGLEMALVGNAAHQLRMPIHQAILSNKPLPGHGFVQLNGLITRGASESRSRIRYCSWKVKVGHQTVEEDLASAVLVLKDTDSKKLRFDANRAWNDTEATSFASHLVNLGLGDLVEFVEEPLSPPPDGPFSLENHVIRLELWSRNTNVPYALDETLADVVSEQKYDYTAVEKKLSAVFADNSRGCAAFVLKPALLGIEMTMQLARLAKQKYGIGAVFSSSFDSGVGLAYTGLLALASDSVEAPDAPNYAHGLATFESLQHDVLAPPFSSYVNNKGELNTASLSRALYGISLDDLHIKSPSRESSVDSNLTIQWETDGEAGVNIALSLPLPFSAETAHSRFTDLPQQPRWSPWLTSVSYQGKQTEWKINIRGVTLKWTATSKLLSTPWLGIEWESVSGVSNQGKVEFIPTDKNWGDSCEMKVQVTIVPPRILNRILKAGASSFNMEDFIRDKIMRWSLEMFRDVVKADMAVEHGDIELGDALHGSLENRANLIEETLNATDFSG